MASTNRYAALGAAPRESPSPPRISSSGARSTTFVNSEVSEHVFDRDEAAVEGGWEVVAAPKKHKKKTYTSEDEKEEISEQAVEPHGIHKTEGPFAIEGTGAEPTKNDVESPLQTPEPNGAPPDESVGAVERSKDVSAEDHSLQLEVATVEPFPVFIDSPATTREHKPNVLEKMTEPPPPTAPSNLKDVVDLQPPVAPKQVPADAVQAYVSTLPLSTHNGGILSAKQPTKSSKDGGQELLKRTAVQTSGGQELGAEVAGMLIMGMVAAVAVIGACVGLLVRR